MWFDESTVHQSTVLWHRFLYKLVKFRGTSEELHHTSLHSIYSTFACIHSLPLHKTQQFQLPDHYLWLFCKVAVVVFTGLISFTVFCTVSPCVSPGPSGLTPFCCIGLGAFGCSATCCATFTVTVTGPSGFSDVWKIGGYGGLYRYW